MARKTGATIVEISVPLPLTCTRKFHDAIVGGMTERTKVVFLSHITSPTALLFPIEAIIAEAQKRDILSIIDGAHTPGHIPLNLDALGADFYSGNCHKWLMSPKGSAFLYARPERQAMLDPLVISHGWTVDNKKQGAHGPFGNSAFVDEVEMQGTRDPAAWLAVPAAIAFRRAHDWWRVVDECHRLAQETANRLRALTGLPPFASPEHCAPQMVAIPLPACDPIGLQEDCGTIRHRNPCLRMARTSCRPPLLPRLQHAGADGLAYRSADRPIGIGRVTRLGSHDFATRRDVGGLLLRGVENRVLC